jgi:hypothetical protein
MLMHLLYGYMGEASMEGGRGNGWAMRWAGWCLLL